MSCAHWAWLSSGSTDSSMILTLRPSNSGLIFATYPSSVVHTGGKSRGCENSTAQLSPIQSWKLIGPSVVCAEKSGAVSPIVSVMTSSKGGFRLDGLSDLAKAGQHQGFYRLLMPPQCQRAPRCIRGQVVGDP